MQSDLLALLICSPIGTPTTFNMNKFPIPRISPSIPRFYVIKLPSLWKQCWALQLSEKMQKTAIKSHSTLNLEEVRHETVKIRNFASAPWFCQKLQLHYLQPQTV